MIVHIRSCYIKGYTTVTPRMSKAGPETGEGAAVVCAAGGRHGSHQLVGASPFGAFGADPIQPSSHHQFPSRGRAAGSHQLVGPAYTHCGLHHRFDPAIAPTSLLRVAGSGLDWHSSTRGCVLLSCFLLLSSLELSDTNVYKP